MTQPAAKTFDAKHFLQLTPKQPGVYQMYDQQDKILYVGKAKSLRQRLASYFSRQPLAPKTSALVKKIARIETTVTNSETEALLLEQNLIKALKPPYNILLRDDKSYPFIYLSNDTFPRLSLHRGRRSAPGEYFGPFPSAYAVKESLNWLQKIFQVRQCENSFFSNRSRPCLQYQIKRCKAPCVDLVNQEEYAKDVAQSRLFLQGKSQQLMYDLIEEMENAANKLEFEHAATLRDRINHLRQIQEQQAIVGSGQGDHDCVSFIEQQGVICFVVLMIRGGRLLGQRTFFHDIALELSQEEQLQEFLAQFYISNAKQRDFPKEVIICQAIPEPSIFITALQQTCGQCITLKHNVRAERLSWLQLAEKNAKQQLAGRLANKHHMLQRCQQLQALLQLTFLPERIECFDISHTQGEATVASCVVFGQEGALKKDYRRYNIQNITPGDDYAAMEQALQRRFAGSAEGGNIPDVLLIDGGKGQLTIAQQVLANYSLSSITLVGVAKGPSRKPGLETLLVSNEQRTSYNQVDPAPDHGGFLLIQQVRDEAHRFAIAGHRNKRSKARQQSVLEHVPGIGHKRRQALLKYFGGIQGISAATITELQKVKGISKSLAQQIYDTLHHE
ncbi:excinuclease ABC subunit UvrC [Zooshikella ganghwensis]|uniref:excinuclease ABC subunit UvrC n=1 Tax=Zooshikella ganghwensis TaxID=202772 RepID=UPI0004268C60|nr:excinuclease ABC subunit UvrC [Zooshikella ganghwensis]